MDRAGEPSIKVRAHIWAVCASAVVAFVLCLRAPTSATIPLDALVVLTVAAALARLFPVAGPRDESYQLTIVFVLAGVFLLPGTAIGLLVIAAHVPDLLRRERVLGDRYVSALNLGGWLIAALLGRLVFVSIAGAGPLSDDRALVASLVTVATFAVADQAINVFSLGLTGRSARREIGWFWRARILIDAALGCVGVIVALLWQESPVLLSLIVAPLFLVRRALATPDLEKQARTDPKTGLYNARHFSRVLQEEFRRSVRFGRPFAIVMADLDLLRNVNNTYGHLVGDAVLSGIAEKIRLCLREYDVAARFGGEEFVILLPECDAERGRVVAERIRQQVAAAWFAAEHASGPVRVTISQGVASFPAHGTTPELVIHQADLAVYQAKLAGRNRVCASTIKGAALGLGASAPWASFAERHLEEPPELGCHLNRSMGTALEASQAPRRGAKTTGRDGIAAWTETDGAGSARYAC